MNVLDCMIYMYVYVTLQLMYGVWNDVLCQQYCISDIVTIIQRVGEKGAISEAALAARALVREGNITNNKNNNNNNSNSNDKKNANNSNSNVVAI